jgi:hypothetical protein
LIERAVGSVTVLGAVRGLVADGERVRARLETVRPNAVGLAVSEDELKGLREYFVDAATEPVVPLAPTEAAEIRALAHYGDVGVPNPSVLAAIRWADSTKSPVSPLDPSDDEYSTMFARSIGYLELVRRTLRERSAGKRPPAAADADAFSLAWSRMIEPGAGSRRLRAQRDAVVAEGVERMRARFSSVAVVVDRERFDGLVELLADGPSLVRTAPDVGGEASR